MDGQTVDISNSLTQKQFRFKEKNIVLKLNSSFPCRNFQLFIVY